MGNESHDFLPDPAQDAPQAGPSWARANWPRVGGEGEDELTRALDPTRQTGGVRYITDSELRRIKVAALLDGRRKGERPARDEDK